MSETFVSRNAFAKLEGCDEKQVRRGIERGVLTVNADGKLAVSQVGSGWRRPRRDSKAAPGKVKAEPASDSSSVRTNVRTSEPEVGDDETAADAAARIAGEAVSVPEMKESLARKEYFNALLKQLEYREKDGSLVDVSLAEQVLFESARGARDAWLNFPTKVGPQLAAQLGLEADKVTEALSAYVHKQIAELGEPEAYFAERQA